ncbi:MAG: hypothetical protein K2W95_09340 [Candidatus Obscuribacterales bacterium]|nr:hypothetical protein [Candidatus Obscuribacterales bacterium]
MSIERVEKQPIKETSGLPSSGPIEVDMTQFNLLHKNELAREPSLPGLTLSNRKEQLSDAKVPEAKPKHNVSDNTVAPTSGPTELPQKPNTPQWGKEYLKKFSHEVIEAYQQQFLEDLSQEALSKAFEQLEQKKPERAWDILFEQNKKAEFLSKTSREIAKSAAFDGTMSPEEKEQMAKAFRTAHRLGCEKELVKSTNDQLKSAGSKHRVFLDTRQSDPDVHPIEGVILGEERKITVVNIDNGSVTDDATFRTAPSLLRRGPRMPSRVDPGPMQPSELIAPRHQ